MNAFDKVIGYESVKTELLQICDILKNKERYERLGAKPPQGIIIYGEPGMGKTLLLKCFIEESGLKAFTVRRNKGNFADEITEIFYEAKKNAPSIILLDDMDKFANEDEAHKDAGEYVAIQTGIDEIKGLDVFVAATVNDIRKLPDSLLRPGRFDRKIELCTPSEEDSEKIVKYYLRDKNMASDISYEDITRMISYSSCAELETVLNEAAIIAGYAKHESIYMEDVISAVLKTEYDSPKSCAKVPKEDLRRTAVHEAGHLVICEVLMPGSIGLASIRPSINDDIGGFVKRCKDLPRRPFHILVSLGGKVATELYYSESCASGCYRDIKEASRYVREGVLYNGTCGIGMINVTMNDISDSLLARAEDVIHSELERYIFKARDILLKNKDFFEQVIEALIKKETLLYSDIQAIRRNTEITDVAV